MPLHATDVATVDALTRPAVERAETLGHHLEPFRAAKRDPSCFVAFCGHCRQMVIVALDERGGENSVFYGYALETRCAAADEHRRDLVPAR